MHGNLLGQHAQLFFVAGRFERNQHGDLAHRRGHSVVHVTRNDTVRNTEGRGAAQVHVLADGRNLVSHFISHGAASAGVVHAQQRVDVAASLERQGRNFTHHLLEGFVTGHEVGFCVQFDR